MSHKVNSGVCKEEVGHKVNIEEVDFEESNIQCYVINRECRVDRKKNMTSIFSELNKLNKSKVDLVFCDNIADKDYLPETLDPEIVSNTNMRKGEICVSISHFNQWVFPETSQINIKAMHEDDIALIHDYNDTLVKYFKLLEEDKEWDIALLSRNCFGDNMEDFSISKEEIKDKNVSEYFFIPKKLGYGAHTYLVNKRCVDKIHDKIYPLTDTIDVLFNKWHESNTLKIYVAKNNVSVPLNVNDSDTS